MSEEKLSKLESEYESLDKELDDLKHKLMEKLQTDHVSTQSEAKQLLFLEKETSDAVSYVKQLYSNQIFEDINAPKMFRQYMLDLTTKYNDVSSKSETLEDSYKKQRITLKESKRSRVFYDQLSDAKAYTKFFAKRLEKMKLDVEDSRDEIIFYIRKAKKKFAKYFMTVEKNQKEDLELYQNKLKKKVQAFKSIQSSVEVAKERNILILNLFQQHLTDVDNRVTLSKAKCDEIQQKIVKLVSLRSSNLMRDFLKELVIKSRMKEISNAFIQYCKSEEGTSLNYEDKEIQKLQNEIKALEEETNNAQRLELQNQVAMLDKELLEN